MFRTQSDTECIVHAYEEYGADCVTHLEGMFAFAVYDSVRREVFIARDRLGKKPLFYAMFGRALHFGSEIKALRASPAWDPELDLSQLEGYMSLGYVMAPATMYRCVRKLPAGHWLRASRRGVQVQRYWDIERFDDHQGSGRALEDEIDDTIRTAVRERLESEVPLGAFLSGGIDSGLVVSYMAEALGPGVTTTSIGFGDANDELDAAALTAARFDTRHHAEVLRPDPESVIDRIVAGFDEPFADASAVPTFHVASMAKRLVTVVLSGDGGDEAFGGYGFRYAPHAVESAVRPWLPGVPDARRGVAGTRWPRSPRIRGAPLGNAPREYRARSGVCILGLVPGEAARRAAAARTRAGSRSEAQRRLRRCDGSVSPLRVGQSAAARAVCRPQRVSRQRRPREGRSHDDAAWDRGARAAPRSARHRAGVQDSGASQDAAAPVEAFVAPAGAPPAAAAARHVAEAGFSPPIGGWLTGRARRAFAMTSSRMAPQSRAAGRQEIRRIFDDHVAGRADHSQALWSVWMLARWSEREREA